MNIGGTGEGSFAAAGGFDGGRNAADVAVQGGGGGSWPNTPRILLL
ncbi:MAG: hypothetical protein IT223_12165 [Crocinitomicaceae bacterium]|nr:hypothetical protein [Crocinitomicaceae bacterium]